MAAISTTETGTDVVFTWVAPDDRGDALTEYEIKIFNKNTNAYVLNSTVCNGALTPVTCTVSMSTLMA